MSLLFDPCSPLQNEPQTPARTIKCLSGATVGFIDNAKPNFNHLVDELEAVLTQQFGVRKVIKRAKRGASMPAPQEIIEELAQQCDLVITGSGD